MPGTPLAYHADLITPFPLIHQGKVRDSFAIDAQHMLIVASDRLSAFDVVMAEPIPGKGEILTQISNFWFERTRDMVPNHLSGIDLADLIEDSDLLQLLRHRAAGRITSVPARSAAFHCRPGCARLIACRR